MLSPTLDGYVCIYIIKERGFREGFCRQPSWPRVSGIYGLMNVLQFKRDSFRVSQFIGDVYFRWSLVLKCFVY